MNNEKSSMQLKEANQMISALREELEETQKGLLLLTLELEKRVEERTAQLVLTCEELRETQKGLLVLTEELEKRVQQCTAQLILTLELEKKEKERALQLAELNHELEAFSYSVSHDLRAPLRSIIGFCRILLEDHSHTVDQLGQEYLNRVIQAAEHMELLIDGLLHLSRLTHQEIYQHQINLSNIVMSIVTELQQLDPKRRVNWLIVPDITVYGDESLLRIGMQNLLENAWKYTLKKSKAIIEFNKIDIEQEEVFFVRDNGSGFDMRYADKLFGVFQRLHHDHEFEGIGIGLATVHRIINRHQGRIWAEGQINQGATFYFTLSNNKKKRKHKHE